MKRYKLLKDLPFVKAGVFFEKMNDYGAVVLEPKDCDPRRHMIAVKEIQNFDEWFEEIEEPEVYYYLSEAGAVIESEWSSGTHYAHVLAGEEFVQNLKSIGNYFETEEEAKAHLKWLKARAALFEDTKGFKPDWKNFSQLKYYVHYNHKTSVFWVGSVYYFNACEIYFRAEKDAEDSIKKHEKEWKIYLGVEDE